VNTGGLCRLRNTSADWDPFYLLTYNRTCITEGGETGIPIVYPCEKELPGNSTVYVDYIANANMNQYLQVTLIWELGAKLKEETFYGYIHPLHSAVVAAVTRASPGYYDIPGGKGGRLFALYHLNWGTLTTAVNSGGLVEVENNAYDMTPAHFYTSNISTVGASGGATAYPDKIPWDGPCPQNSRFTTYFTPNNALEQTMSTLFAWKRPVRRTVA
jgi:hypothetical protein